MWEIKWSKAHTAFVHNNEWTNPWNINMRSRLKSFVVLKNFMTKIYVSTSEAVGLCGYRSYGTSLDWRLMIMLDSCDEHLKNIAFVFNSCEYVRKFSRRFVYRHKFIHSISKYSTFLRFGSWSTSNFLMTIRE